MHNPIIKIQSNVSTLRYVTCEVLTEVVMKTYFSWVKHSIAVEYQPTVLEEYISYTS
jgi:hypothetical protein